MSERWKINFAQLVTDATLDGKPIAICKKDEAQQCAALIAAANRAEAERWIPVSERLPEEGKLVIVDGGVAIREYGKWYSQTGDDTGRRIEWPVTHWRPLPAPPKEVNNG